jgi:hypothetical protein
VFSAADSQIIASDALQSRHSPYTPVVVLGGGAIRKNTR